MSDPVYHVSVPFTALEFAKLLQDAARYGTEPLTAENYVRVKLGLDTYAKRLVGRPPRSQDNAQNGETKRPAGRPPLSEPERCERILKRMFTTRMVKYAARLDRPRITWAPQPKAEALAAKELMIRVAAGRERATEEAFRALYHAALCSEPLTKVPASLDAPPESPAPAPSIIKAPRRGSRR